MVAQPQAMVAVGERTRAQREAQEAAQQSAARDAVGRGVQPPSTTGSCSQSIYGTPVVTGCPRMSRAAPTATSLVVGTWDQLSAAFGLQSQIEAQVGLEKTRLREGLRKTINDGGTQMALSSSAAQSEELSGMNYEMLVQVGPASLSLAQVRSSACTSAIAATGAKLATF